MTKALKYVKLAVLLLAITFVMLTFSACDAFGSGDVVAPKLDSNSPPQIQRINPDYYNPQTKQDEVYYDPEATMPVRAGESVYLVIDYNNQSNLSINRVVFSGGGEKHDVRSMDFHSDSNSDRTIIEFDIADVEPKTDLTYTISDIYYNSGAQVVKMSLNKDLSSITVVVEPKFIIFFDHQNADPRTGKQKTSTTIVDIDYFQSLEQIIPGRNDVLTAPEKEGGWAYRGYYTMPGGPDGGGVEIKQTDRFYFWKSLTLYAHYERLYEFEHVDLDEPIPYDDGEYLKGVIVTEKTNAGGTQESLEIYDTIADDEGVYPIIGIADMAFSNTKNMRTLKIGRYVKSIGRNTFDGSNMEEVILHPESVLERIEKEAFRDTTELTSFDLPSTLKYLGDGVFRGSGIGGEITINPNITYMGDYVFSRTAVTSVKFSAGVEFEDGKEKGEEFYIGTHLFYGCQNIKAFRTFSDDEEEPNGLRVVPDFMFSGFSYKDDAEAGLQTLILAEGLKRIGKGAFNWQKLLTTVNLPASLEDLGGNGFIDSLSGEAGVFEECVNLREVNFAEGSQLKVLGAYTFWHNIKLHKIEFLTDQLEYYGNAPFFSCDSLTEVHFSNSINAPEPLENKMPPFGVKADADLFYASGDETASFKVFVQKQALEAFRDEFGATGVYSYDMEKIGARGDDEYRMIFEDASTGAGHHRLVYLFNNEKNIDLTNLTYGYGETYNITEIGSHFVHKNIETIILPGMVVNILGEAFKNCQNLTEVNYTGANTLQFIGQQAFYNTAITDFTGGTNLHTIGTGAFYSAKSLIWVDLKESSNLTSVGNSAFEKASALRYVRFPSNFATMTDAIFADCVSLNFLVFEKNVPNPDMFSEGLRGTYFQGVPHGITTCYVMENEAVQAYNELDNLPYHLSNSFQYRADDPTPERLGIV